MGGSGSKNVFAKCKIFKNVKFKGDPGIIKSVGKSVKQTGAISVLDPRKFSVIQTKFGLRVSPVRIEMKGFDKGLFDFVELPLYQTFGDGVVIPPQIETRITEEEEQPEFDTSGCRLAFANAMRKVIQSHIEKREKAEKARERGDEIVEPEGVIVKQSQDDMQKAIADLRNCLSKGKTTPEALREIVIDEAKSAVVKLVKEKFASAAPLKEFIETSQRKQTDFRNDYASLLKECRAELSQIETELQRFNMAALRDCKAFEDHRQQLAELFKGMTADYKDIVSDSKGTTSMRPGVVKALEKLRETGDEVFVADALKQLRQQKQTIQGEMDKLDEKGKKASKTTIERIEFFEKLYLV